MIAYQSFTVGSGIPFCQVSQAANGVSKTVPIREYHTTISNVVASCSPFLCSIIRLVLLVVIAQHRAAKRIIKSPRILSSNGISVLGLHPVTTATPMKPQNRPRNILRVICWPSIGAANSTVNTGLKVMINEASPAAVKRIPLMKNN